MIIKLAQNLKWRYFRSNKRLVKAVRMREDFLLETPLGFVDGKKGEWVVEAGDKIRFPCDEKVFLKSYTQPKEAEVPGRRIAMPLGRRWDDR